MIDPSFWDDEDLGLLCAEERLIMVAAISQSDDWGKLPGSAAFFKKVVFGFTDTTVEQVESWLTNVANRITGFHRYEVDGKLFIALLHWLKYQRVDHPQPSTIPDPSGVSFSERSKNDSKNDSENDSKNDSEIHSVGVPSKERKKEISTKEVSTKEAREAAASSTTRKKIIERYQGSLHGSMRDSDTQLLEDWIADYGEDAVLNAVSICREASRDNPKSFIGAVLRKQKATSEQPADDGYEIVTLQADGSKWRLTHKDAKDLKLQDVSFQRYHLDHTGKDRMVSDGS